MLFRSSLTGGSDTSTSGPLTTEITTNLTTNFPASAKAYSAGGAIKLGSSSGVGSITSVPLDLSGNGGVFSIKFDVKGWTTVEGQIKVTVGNLPAQTVSYTATISGSYETKTLNFTGGQANSTVKIETTAKRAFIDNVQVLTTASVATPVIYSPLTAAGSVGSPFTYSILASNSPTSYGASGLPTGLTNNSSTGVISGTPTTAGTNSVTITASNSGGTDTKTLVLTVSPPPPVPVISSSLTATAMINSSFNYQITASGSPTSYAATGLPAGLSVNSGTGAITGSATELGTFNVTISASNVTGTGSANLVLTVASSIPAPVITSSGTASGTVGSAFSYQITASNSPSSYGASGLPGGLSVNTSSGVISGTPTSAGTALVTVSANNAGGTGSSTLVLTVQPAPAVLATLFQEDFVSVTNGNSTNTSGSSTGWTGNTNFPTVGAAYQAGGSVKIGSGSTNGSLTSKTLDLSTNGGKFTLSYKVKGWSTVEGSIKVTVGAVTQTNTYTNTMSGLFEAKDLVFSNGTSNMTLKIETTTKRAFIDDVVVTSGSSSNPTLSSSGSIGSLASVYGSASGASTPLTLTGTNLAGNVTVSAPAGFEISQTAGGGSGYSATQILVPASGALSNVLYVRLAGTNPVGTYSGLVVFNTTNGAGLTASIPNSTVAKKDISITGLIALDKVYDATTLAAFSGTPVYAGLINGDSFTVSGNPSAAFGSAGVGSAKTVTVTGYNAPSGNYNLLPTSLTAAITPKPVAITGVSGVDKTYDGTVTAGLSGTAQVSDVLVADLSNVTVAGTPTASFASANVGADVGITVTGYSLSGSASSNYWLGQPSGLSANITPRSATVTAESRTKNFGQVLTLGANQSSGFLATGLASGEKVDKVTLTASGGTAADAAAGSYTITPSDASASPSIPPNPFRSENYSITYVNGTLTVLSAATEVTINDWATQNGLSGVNALPEADPDGDGIPNLMEFFLGLDPTQSGGTRGPVMTLTNGSSNTVSMTYRRAKGITGVSSAVQASGDLSSSNSWGTNGVQETVTDKGSYEEVTATVTNAPGETRKFMRLKVSQP